MAPWLRSASDSSGRRRARTWRGAAAAAGIAVAAAGIGSILDAPAAGAAVTSDQQSVASYQALQSNLYLSLYQLYRAVPATTTNQFSYLWPFTNAMAGTDYLAAIPAGSQYQPDLAARLQGLLKYRNPAPRSPSGALQPPAFSSGVMPPLGPGGDIYYDDNAWAALDLLHQYDLTHDGTYLTYARQAFDFIVTGWSTTFGKCPGGVYWVDASWSRDRNTTSTAPAAAVAARLYQITRTTSYLSWAQRMYNWVNGCLRDPATGLYWDHISSNGTINKTFWSYNQGSMAGAGVLLYKVTGNTSYLTAADKTARAAVSYFGTGSVLSSQGPAFNGIYFRNLFLLNTVRPNPNYAAQAQAYATDMWNNDRDPATGLFLPTSSGVNGTAPMVETYALLAGSAP